MALDYDTVDNSGEKEAVDDEYIDYELFTSPDFNATVFCNQLVLATNTASDPHVDLNAAQQRVQFDLEEVEKLLHKEAVENHSSLISHAQKLNVVDSVLTTAKTSLGSVTQSFSRLDHEVLTPYHTALPIYRVLTKLHATANLLRAFTWFMYLVRQLSGVQQQAAKLVANSRVSSPAPGGERSRSATPSYGQHQQYQQARPQMNAADAAEASRLNVRAAKTYAEMTRHLSGFPKLRTLKAVNEVEAAVKASRDPGGPPLR
ncbi:Golgi transport complex subunit 5-domain-containing protein [Myxozyma melibiosi]|uniref:Golgi transport complex subunit 5-domain-containing protein n=1 Tax=Myxozyma melibiosi TaxID=54550 RepID=A0ABR1FDE7_9ASCO